MRSCALAGNTLYFGATGTLMRLLLSENTIEVVGQPTGSGDWMWDMAVANQYVYSAPRTGRVDEGTISRTEPLSGTSLLLARGDLRESQVAIDETHVYFIETKGRTAANLEFDYNLVRVGN
jgi:hypothetical protein